MWKLESHTKPVNCICFYRDYAVSCSDDGTVKLWNVRSGEHVRDLVKLNGTEGLGGDGGGGAGAGVGGAEPPRRVVAWRFLQSPCYLVLAAGGSEEDGHTGK